MRDVVKNIGGFTDEHSRVISATHRHAGRRAARGQRLLRQRPGAGHREVRLQDELADAPARLAARGTGRASRIWCCSATSTSRRKTATASTPSAWRETIHHTTEERDHFKALLELGLTDSFRLFEQPEKSYSWWDYRMLGYQKNRGLRIDHILVSDAAGAAREGLHDRPRAAQVGKAQRPCAGDPGARHMKRQRSPGPAGRPRSASPRCAALKPACARTKALHARRTGSRAGRRPAALGQGCRPCGSSPRRHRPCAPTARSARRHIYKKYPKRIYKGKIPPLVYAVVVTETEVDANGQGDGRVLQPHAEPRAGGERR